MGAPINNDRRMAELYTERAEGWEHELYIAPDGKWEPAVGYFVPCSKYRKKAKEHYVWIATDKDQHKETWLFERRPKLKEGTWDDDTGGCSKQLSWSGGLVGAPAGECRKFKLVPVDE